MFGGEGEHPTDPKLTALLDDLYVFGATGWSRFFGSGKAAAALPFAHAHSPNPAPPDMHSRPPQYTQPGASPGGRSEHSSVVFEQGFYVFGGLGVAYNSNFRAETVQMADLWTFSLQLKAWTFLGGSVVPNSWGTYPGAIGLGGSDFAPGARVQASMAINELTNDLFLFGGFGLDYNMNYGYLNDLWRFNLNANQWTWMGGSSSISKGGSITSGSLFAPCGRSGALLFAGSDGLQFNLTLLGGVANPTGTKAGALADVWTINTELPSHFTIEVPPSTRTQATHATAPPSTQVSRRAVTVSPVSLTLPQRAASTTASPAVTNAVAAQTSAMTTPAPAVGKVTVAPTHAPLFDSTSPQKIAALVMGSFIAIVIIVGGIIFLGFAMTSGSAGARTVAAEPYSLI